MGVFEVSKLVVHSSFKVKHRIYEDRAKLMEGVISGILCCPDFGVRTRVFRFLRDYTTHVNQKPELKPL